MSANLSQNRHTYRQKSINVILINIQIQTLKQLKHHYQQQATGLVVIL